MRDILRLGKRAIGDVYAINNKDGYNPPVYLIDHEYDEETEEILENKLLVVRELSDLFKIETFRTVDQIIT
jgi:hypothetical protein